MADVNSIYQQALSNAQTQYSQISAGYNALLASQQAAEAQTIGGYNTLSNQVQGAIQGVTASQSQAIKDVYTQQSGQQQQQLINSGLGNSTVLSSVNRGLTLDEQKAQVALSNQQAQLQAGYLSSIGLAGLGYQGQATQANTALGAQGLSAQQAGVGVESQLYGGYAGAVNQQQALAQQLQLGQGQLRLGASGLQQQGYAQQQALGQQAAAQQGQLGYQYAALAAQQGLGYNQPNSLYGTGGSIWGTSQPNYGYGGGYGSSLGGGLSGGLAGGYGPVEPNNVLGNIAGGGITAGGGAALGAGGGGDD